jgi:hypothetical protein
MTLTHEERVLYAETAQKLSGPDRRRFMALTAKHLGPGWQTVVTRVLGWCVDTVRKGLRELESKFPVVDDLSTRGRKLAEEHLPNLIADIRDIVDSQCQTDPRFQTQRLYRRISAPEVRRQLIERKNYTDTQLPCVRCLENKLNQLGYLSLSRNPARHSQLDSRVYYRSGTFQRNA